MSTMPHCAPGGYPRVEAEPHRRTGARAGFRLGRTPARSNPMNRGGTAPAARRALPSFPAPDPRHHDDRHAASAASPRGGSCAGRWGSSSRDHSPDAYSRTSGPRSSRSSRRAPGIRCATGACSRTARRCGGARWRGTRSASPSISANRGDGRWRAPSPCVRDVLIENFRPRHDGEVGPRPGRSPGRQPGARLHPGLGLRPDRPPRRGSPASHRSARASADSATSTAFPASRRYART